MTRVCKVCKKPKRDCVLPCRLAKSSFTEDERFAQWLQHIYRNLNKESDRLDPDRKRPGGVVACLDNAVNNIGTAFFYLTGKHILETS